MIRRAEARHQRDRRQDARVRKGPAVMCNLYSQTKGQQAIVALARAMRDRTGNLPPLPGIFPDYQAPVVRNAPDGVRELAMLRWGMPMAANVQYEAAGK